MRSLLLRVKEWSGTMTLPLASFFFAYTRPMTSAFTLAHRKATNVAGKRIPARVSIYVRQWQQSKQYNDTESELGP
jgi:hypothetical protein